jgi:hypothetical protein
MSEAWRGFWAVLRTRFCAERTQFSAEAYPDQRRTYPDQRPARTRFRVDNFVVHRPPMKGPAGRCGQQGL